MARAMELKLPKDRLRQLEEVAMGPSDGAMRRRNTERGEVLRRS